MSDKLTGRLVELRRGLLPGNLLKLAACCGADLEQANSVLRLSFFDQPVAISFPDLLIVDAKTGAALPEATQAILLYYLTTADGTPPEGRWLSFADLPDGRFYNQAFQGYSGAELVKYFGNDLTAFERAGYHLNGVKIAYGDNAFAFHILPRLMLSVIYHLGDEDFPASCQILFDASASHYLPTDVCAILGSMLTRKLLAA
jgi:hypothetical protein